MNRSLVLIVSAAVVITGGVFLFKNNLSKVNELQSPKESGTILKKDGGSEAEMVAGTVPSESQKHKQNPQEMYEEKLRSQGFTEDPNDPYNFVKKVKKADGTFITHMAPKNLDESKYFDPPDKDAKTAEETLLRKKELNPTEEMASLKRLDDNDQNTVMLLGKFRDDSNDLEITFAPVSDLQNNPLEKDMTCLVSPKLNLNFKKTYSGEVKTDDTGYALIKFDEQTYVRVAWYWDADSGRILLGNILAGSGGQYQITKSFAAKEARGSAIKYCQ